MSQCHYEDIPSPLGPIRVLVSDEGVQAVLWQNEREGRLSMPVATRGSHPVLEEARRQLIEYLDGSRTDFDLPLAPVGTPFQQRVWKELRRIPYGQTISYGEQARRMGEPGKARAVGAANGRNPLSIFIPCHRVIGADGRLTGFAAGLEVKQWLLDHERSHRC